MSHVCIQQACQNVIIDMQKLINEFRSKNEIKSSPYCNNMIITPIAKKYKKNGPDSRKDYEEQLIRESRNMNVMWDDTKRNESRVGDYFGFYQYNNEVSIRRVESVQNPLKRLDSWSENVGQGNRNVLLLSEEIINIKWNIWLELGGAKRCMGSQAVKTNLEIIVSHIERRYMDSLTR